jgi:uncharacterized protein (DUF1697 family)
MMGGPARGKKGGPTRYAALLRGVNVGGNKKIAMADLRLLLTGLGHGDVKTLLQSGNAVFTADSADAPAVAAMVEAALAADLGLVSRVLLRSGPQMAAIVAANPFPSAEEEPSKHLVQFLFEPVTDADRELLAGLDPAGFAPEDYRVGERVIYFRHLPSISDSKLGVAYPKYLAAAYPKVAARPVMTGRNWNTVRKLAELTQT